MTTSRTTRDRIHIAFDDRGTGEPALLCMPGWCSDRFQFEPLVPTLSDRRRTLVLDWRGHGDSDTPEADYGHEDLVEDALAVVDSAGIESFIGVAAAHAGWAGIGLRRIVGKRMVGLVALSWMVTGAPPPFLAGLERLQTAEGWSEVRDQLFDMWRGGGNHPGVEEQIAHMKRAPAETWRRAGREIAAAYSSEISPIDALSSLDPPLPTLHIYAQPDDPAVLREQAELSDQNPWFQVQKVKGRSHFPQFETPTVVADLIDKFASSIG